MHKDKPVHLSGLPQLICCCQKHAAGFPQQFRGKKKIKSGQFTQLATTHPADPLSTLPTRGLFYYPACSLVHSASCSTENRYLLTIVIINEKLQGF